MSVSTITIAAIFTRNSGEPATGLALSDIDFYLTRQVRLTGEDNVVWDGTQNPVEEMDNVGTYIRIYNGANLDLYNYHGAAEYTGAVVLDQDWITGALGVKKKKQ